MEPAAQTLSYTDLPQGSRIVCEQREGTLHIILPPTGFWAEAKWVSLMVGVLVMMALIFMGYVWYTLPVPTGSMWAAIRQLPWLDGVMMLLAVLGVCLLFSWIIGNVGIEIELTADKLILRRSLWRFRWQQEWPRESIDDVRCRFSVVFIRTRKGLRSSTINRNNRAERQWLVRTLRQATGMPV